jgi:methyl-accepting chemotaxis protein
MSVKSRLYVAVCITTAMMVAVGVVGVMHLSGGPLTLMLGLTALTIVLLVSVAAMTQSAITAPLQRASDMANRVASGDLTVKIETDGQGEFGKLMLALQSMDENLTRMVNDIRTSAEAIHTSAAEVASGNANLSQRTEEQASTLEQTATSMEQLTSAVQKNTESARKANALAKSANAVAAQGGQVVSEVVTTMNQIQESSRKIADIISVIDSIAFQTNILALNAAVEAARAGEQGRGFAVVASEVRSLAQRSADAAKEIKGLISNSVERVDAGTQLVQNAGKTMSDIVESVGRVTSIMDQIATASAEQSGGIGQVNQAISQMEQVVQQNAAVVEQATAAAESMRSQAQILTQVASVFKLNTQDAVRLNRRRDPSRDPRAAAPGARHKADARAPAAPPLAAERPAKKHEALAHKPPPSGDDGEWKEF